MISDGSVGTFCLKTTLPASVTTHTDVSFTDTSRPTKCAISSLLPRCSRPRQPRSKHRHRRGCALIIQAEPQPPRYTIFLANLGSAGLHRRFRLDSDLRRVWREPDGIIRQCRSASELSVEVQQRQAKPRPAIRRNGLR